MDNVSLDVAPGEILGIIGRNGAGKSTLLTAVSGVLKPVSGAVEVGGRIAPLLQVGSAFDYQLTGRENVYLNAAFLGFTRQEVDQCYDSIVDFAELAAFMEADFRTFSSGMAARLGFAVATAARADVLLVDEVLSVGDEHFRQKCEQRIDDFRRQRVTILFVSHDLLAVQDMCTRAIWLESGRIRADGQPESVIREYRDFIAGL